MFINVSGLSWRRIFLNEGSLLYETIPVVLAIFISLRNKLWLSAIIPSSCDLKFKNWFTYLGWFGRVPSVNANATRIIKIVTWTDRWSCTVWNTKKNFKERDLDFKKEHTFRGDVLLFTFTNMFFRMIWRIITRIVHPIPLSVYFALV